MDRQAVCDVLNSLEVVEMQGGEDAYILVDNSVENRSKLISVGITEQEINDVGGIEGDTFCILALAFNGNRHVDECQSGKFIVWGPLDDEFRHRVLNGEGTPIDAERLLRMAEPELFA